MKAEGKCEWLQEIRETPSETPEGEPIREVVHNYPKTDIVERHVTMIGDKTNGDDI